MRICVAVEKAMITPITIPAIEPASPSEATAPSPRDETR